MAGLNPRDVFVNCPFDDAYQPLFRAILYAVIRSGYRVRCALEADNAGTNRIDKIMEIIAECRFGIHDICRTELDATSNLPRFNMPFELGLFYGARRYGGAKQNAKVFIIFDTERFRFQQFISDIAGVDIRAHTGQPKQLLSKLSEWFRTQSNAPAKWNAPALVPGGNQMSSEFDAFNAALPKLCELRSLKENEVTFSDLNTMMTDYVALVTAAPAS